MAIGHRQIYNRHTMTKYTEQKFNIPELVGISTKTVEEHLKLYAGYVKSANLIIDKIGELMTDSEKNAYVLGELQRRFSFEFNGMRNHEYYFKSLEGGAHPLPANSMLKAHIEKQAPSFDAWLAGFKSIALTRGIGWVMLYWDTETKQLTHAWVDEQHLGQLNGCQLILGLDMWEHSFYFDYQTDKKKYVEAFFNNLNWEVIEENFKKAQ
jgi:Fe-Mn family superoxide dismutase